MKQEIASKGTERSHPACKEQDGKNGIKLSKYSRCSSALYCSKNCQTDRLVSEHQQACKRRRSAGWMPEKRFHVRVVENIICCGDSRLRLGLWAWWHTLWTWQWNKHASNGKTNSPYQWVWSGTKYHTRAAFCPTTYYPIMVRCATLELFAGQSYRWRWTKFRSYSMWLGLKLYTYNPGRK